MHKVAGFQLKNDFYDSYSVGHAVTTHRKSNKGNCSLVWLITRGIVSQHSKRHTFLTTVYTNISWVVVTGHRVILCTAGGACPPQES